MFLVQMTVRGFLRMCSRFICCKGTCSFYTRQRHMTVLMIPFVKPMCLPNSGLDRLHVPFFATECFAVPLLAFAMRHVGIAYMGQEDLQRL